MKLTVAVGARSLSASRWGSKFHDKTMASIFVTRKVSIPMVGTWKWKSEDYKVPLVFHLSGARCSLYLDAFDPGKHEREVLWEANFLIEFLTAPDTLARGLKGSGQLAAQAADLIYGLYIQIHEQFEGVLRTCGNVINLRQERPLSFEEFFGEKSILEQGVQWWVDGENPKQFKLKLTRDRRRVNPLFKHDQIMTVKKWKKLQVAIDNRDFPSAEMLELLRIRSRLEWREKKIATIESAILVETIISGYGEKVMTKLGFSKNKIKALRDDLTFNTILNIVLPLSLTKAEAKKMAGDVQGVDLLRKIRNDVVHGNIREEDIDDAGVRKGIAGAVRLIEFIKKKLANP